MEDTYDEVEPLQSLYREPSKQRYRFRQNNIEDLNPINQKVKRDISEYYREYSNKNAI